MRGHDENNLARMMLAFRSRSLFVSKKFLNLWKFFCQKVPYTPFLLSDKRCLKKH